MIIINNIYILFCSLILLNQWNTKFFCIFDSNIQVTSFFAQAFIRRSGNNDKQEKNKNSQKKEEYIHNYKNRNQNELGEQDSYNIDQRKSNEKDDIYNNKPLVAQLSNGEVIPYIGILVGHLQDDKISSIVSDALFSSNKSNDDEENNLGYRLFDTTARTPGNEILLSKAISSIASKNRVSNPESKPITIHVVTKIWYTKLGYERAKISMQESMKNILGNIEEKSHVNIKIHVLINWPRCYDEIDWMNCVEEEEALPGCVKEAGKTIPHENPFAFLGSWRAMEEMYNEHFPTIASIGVANFELDQMEILLQSATIKPHIYQGNLEMTTLALPLLRDHKIHPQLYGVFRALTSQQPVAKIDVARRHLITLANEMSSKEADSKIVPATLLLSFLLQRSSGIMVRISSKNYLTQNSPKNILEVPTSLTSTQHDRLLHILDSIQYHWKAIEEKNYKVEAANEKVHVSFYNKLPRNQAPVSIFYVGKDSSGKEKYKKIIENMESSKTVYVESHSGHVFSVRDSIKGNEITRFQVNARYGQAEWFSVEV